MAIKPVELIIRAKDEASSILGGVHGKLTAIAAAIASYFGVTAFIGAVKGAADLEAKLSEVKAVSGATASEMVMLRKAAEDAGATTKFTATEAATALGNLTRAGISAKDAVVSLPAVLQLAQAGGIDLGKAAEYVTKTIMGMGLAFTDAGRVADVLAMGANASNTSVSGLAEAMSYAAPLAKTLGLGLETTVAIIGKFADAGIDASRAGTALNAIMSQFADPTSKFRTELAAAGIITTNFEQALRQLAAAGPAGSKAITAVGTEAGPALRALLNQGIGALDELKGKLEGAAGSAAKTAAIMEGNLNGAFHGLSSSWDTVKNALATPVLPVLTSGVQSLSNAFTDAVGSGIVGKFGDSIATAFEGGIKWAKAFFAQADFGALAIRLQAFAADTQATFTKIGEAATNAGNVVRLVYGVMSAGTNGVLTAVYGLGVAVSGVVATAQKALALLYEGMAKITFGGISEKYKQMAADVRLSAEATSAASRAMADKTIESFNAMGESAQVARNGWSGLTNATQAASSQAAASNPVFKAMADSLTGVGTAATEAGTKAQQSADKQQAAALATKERVAALHAEYEAAVATGNWQLATEKLQGLANAANAAKASTADLKKQAEEDAAAIAASFERMGIKTKSELSTIANVAKQDFERIKASGQATTEGLQAAYKKVAEAAIAANGGVATEAIKSEAAMRGLQITTDATGKSIVSAMDSASGATQKFGGHVRDTTADIERQAEALRTLKAIADRSSAPVANRDKISKDNPYGLTSDGLSANKDGSVKGTFTNMIPMDQATRLLDANKSGQTVNMTQAEYDTAKKQAKDAYEFMQALAKNSPGAASSEFVQSTTALMIAANTARVNITDKPTSQSNTQATQQNQSSTIQSSAKTYTVNLNVDGSRIPASFDTDANAKAFIAALQRSRLSA